MQCLSLLTSFMFGNLLLASTMLKSNDPLYRRIRAHASKAIRFMPETPGAERLKAYKQFLKLERQMIARHHRKGDSGLRIARCGAILVDVMLESIVRTALLTYSSKEGTLPCQFALLGLGGYGRGELNPLSDVDIMFLFPDKVKSTQVGTMKSILTDEVLYPMWDLGFKVGHSTRTVKECIEESQVDYKTRNSLLESRLILGSSTIHKEMENTYRAFLDGMDIRPYLEEMIRVQEDRRTQYGGSIFAPEPNVKNGVGGLRDYQGVQWLLHLMYGRVDLNKLYNHDSVYARDVREFDAAYEFLLRVRNELHFNSRRATDELTIGMQCTVADKLGYTGTPMEQVEGLMKDYYFHARNHLRIAKSIEQRVLTTCDQTRTKRRRLFRMSFKKTVRKEIEGFVVEDDRISLADGEAFVKDPGSIIRMFRMVQVMNLKPSFELQRQVVAELPRVTAGIMKDADFCDHFRSMLTTPGKVSMVLEEMHNTGFLNRMIPEFEMLSCLIQHDRFFVRFAEDQKVFNSIQRLDKVLSDPKHEHRKYLPELMGQGVVTELYWELLLYSLKYPGYTIGVSSPMDRKGADIFAILNRLKVDRKQSDRIVSFIDKHRNVARFWQQSDADDSRLVHQLAQVLNDHETASSSFWFHYCESLGRNPQYWRIRSLESAYQTFCAVTEEIERGVLRNESNPENSTSQKDMTRLQIKDNTIPDVCVDEIDAHFQLLPNRYFESRSVEDVELHISLVHRLLETIQQAESLGSLKPIIDWRDDENGNFSVITVVTWDRSGLFYKLAGAISSAGMNILKARAISRKDHIAIDSFYVSHGKTGKVKCDEVRHTFEDSIEAILVNGEKAIGKVREQYELSRNKNSALSQNPYDAALPVKVDLYFDPELKQVVADYQGKDRIGLLYQVSRTLSKEKMNIDSVRIATNNGIATGTIFLTDENRERKNDPERLTEIREKLIAILSSESWLIS